MSYAWARRAEPELKLSPPEGSGGRERPRFGGAVSVVGCPRGGYGRAVDAPEVHPSARVVGAVYGQILATAIVATLSEDSAASASEIFFGVAVAMLVFWLAHVYAEAVAVRLDRDQPLTVPEVWRVAVQEWPEAQAAIPALAALGLGWVGVLPGTPNRPCHSPGRGGAIRLGVPHRPPLPPLTVGHRGGGGAQRRLRPGHRGPEGDRPLTPARRCRLPPAQRHQAASARAEHASLPASFA